MQAQTQKNPLYCLSEFPQFNEIRPTHAVPAVRTLIQEAEQKVSDIEKNCVPTWEGRVVSLRNALRPLSRTWRIIEHLLGVSNSAEWREAEQTLQPEIVVFMTRVMQSRPLYDSLIAITKSEEYKSFNQGKIRVIESEIRSAKNNGVGLNDSDREKFNELLKELSVLTTKFSNNVLDATKEFSITLTSPDDVKGLPQTVLEMCAQSARDNGEKDATAKTGPWRISLEHSIYAPVMQYCERRDLREKMYRANIAKASVGDFDNSSILSNILDLRLQIAKLVGYNSYAEMSLSSKMAGCPDAVYEMNKKLEAIVCEKAKNDFSVLNTFAIENGFAEAKVLKNWDVPYWARTQVESLFGFSSEKLRPYFPLNRVLDKLFELSKKLFGVKIKEETGLVETWHPDVVFFRVMDGNDKTIAWLYLDPYSRPMTKQGGAWMNEFQTRDTDSSDTTKLPIALIVCNQATPVDGKPSCMNPYEVATLFHEFGHALQCMLTKIGIPEASGINNIEWDAVEISSQFMENWFDCTTVLKSISQHIETGEQLPDELISKIQDSKTHHAAMQMSRQLGFSEIDMLLHDKFPSQTYPTIQSAEQSVAKRFSTIPPLPEDRFLCSFSHIFAGGYAAGYYSYMWADVLAADAFGMFEEAGLDDEDATSKLGQRFADTILADGGARSPMDVFKDFRGRAPDINALLRQKALIFDIMTHK